MLIVLLGWATHCSPCQGLATTERRPWEIVRFVQQSSKFIQVPFFGRTTTRTVQTVRPGDSLWVAGRSMSTSSSTFTMAPLDDVVMGGASASTFDDATGTWSGTVTDANNGGFIGIRSTPALQWDCSACRGLEWKVRLFPASDVASQPKQTRRFKFVLRDSTEFNGITWTTSVDLKPGAVQSIKIPFSQQVPALFARKVPNQTFCKDNVVGVQVSFSKFAYDGDRSWWRTH